ncbi:MAG: MiaB/RimO family radical SAM methylthiotransferase [Chloroflexi bacterium]|nr:MiaB/RimO family radical SAM methylthiotransferase [Chloroflexota bacterium]
MPQYHIWTIGCQMNKAESERLGSRLEEKGYRATSTAEEADIIVLNSCVVRQSAENRVVNKLRSLKALKAKQDTTLALTGCMVNSEVTRLKKDFPYVDYFFKAGGDPPWLEKQAAPVALPRHPSPSAFVPVIQGCDNFCAYCIVPYRRGREKSRAVSEISCEVRELVNRGVKEVTLLGQNVDSYGHDLPDKPDLADLLAELNRITGLARIRFLTNHPKDMSSRLIEATARLGKVCEHMNLPVQSGDNDILKAMRRDYTVEHYRQLINDIRSNIPGIALSTDIIVGFPSETSQQFQHTVDLLTGIRFDTIHIAAYSPRSGTLAAERFEDNIPPAEKKERLNEIEKLQEKIAAETGVSQKTVSRIKREHEAPTLDTLEARVREGMALEDSGECASSNAAAARKFLSRASPDSICSLSIKNVFGLERRLPFWSKFLNFGKCPSCMVFNSSGSSSSGRCHPEIHS